MILLPVGHDESGVRRLPWISFGVMIVCVVAFFMTGRSVPFAEDDLDYGRRAAEAHRYWCERPYLQPDPEIAARLGFPARPSDGAPNVEATEALRVDTPTDPEQIAAEQREFDRMLVLAAESLRVHPLTRWGLVPSDIGPLSFVTHMFLHAGWLHLLGNLFLFYLAGPFIEDVWGRPLFAGFYLTAGLVAALTHVAMNPDSSVPLVGASGAIAGVMGAFLIRYRTTKIRFFYMIGVFVRGTFSAPAWIMLSLWFGQQLFLASMTHGREGGGVAYMAHVGGFVFGLAAAGLIATQGVERRWVEPALAPKLVVAVVSRDAVERAFEERDAGRPELAIGMLVDELQSRPDDPDTAAALLDIAADAGRGADATAPVLAAIGAGLRRSDPQAALALWSDLVWRVPSVNAEPGLLLRLARVQIRAGEREAAATTLRRALLASGSRPAAADALRLARLACGVEPRLVGVAAKLAITAADVSPEVVVEAERLLAGATRPAALPVERS